MLAATSDFFVSARRVQIATDLVYFRCLVILTARYGLSLCLTLYDCPPKYEVRLGPIPSDPISATVPRASGWCNVKHDQALDHRVWDSRYDRCHIGMRPSTTHLAPVNYPSCACQLPILRPSTTHLAPVNYPSFPQPLQPKLSCARQCAKKPSHSGKTGGELRPSANHPTWHSARHQMVSPHHLSKG